MGIKQNVFGLEQIYRLQVEGQWSTRGEVWNSVSANVGPAVGAPNLPYGYFELGENRSNPYPWVSSTLERIDFSNDTATASVRANFSANAGGVSSGAHSFSGLTFGYAAAQSPYPQKYEKVDFTNDTATIVATTGGWGGYFLRGGATSTNSFGYFNGENPSGPAGTVIFRFDYANDDTDVKPRANLNVSRYWMSGNGNQDFGYFNSGVTSWSSDYTSVVERIDYSNDLANALLRGPLNVDNTYKAGLNAATGNADFSYIAGGFNRTTVNRIDYSSDTTVSLLRGPLSDSNANKGATGSLDFGYFGGGQNGTTKVDRVDYSNDTVTASPKGPLSGTKYWGGQGGMGSQKNGNTAVLSALRLRPNLFVAPQPDTGYFAGGRTPSVVSTIDRVDYSNDTATASVRGPLDAANEKISGVGNAGRGYFSTYSFMSYFVRVDYANDTLTAMKKGNLTGRRADTMSTGNQSFGYFAGGYDQYQPATTYTRTELQRIDYSNDGENTLQRANLPAPSISGAATGNQSFGYFGGGRTGPALTTLSVIDRLDYSSDTAGTSPKGPLSSVRRSLGATGNADFGYFGGGNFGGTTARSTVDRVDYSNDTATASPKGPLSAAKYGLAATGNTSFGYFGGGSPSGPHQSTVDRVDFANDTATAVAKGPLSSARSYLGATGSKACANPNNLREPGFILGPVAFGAFSTTGPTPVGTDFGYMAGGFAGSYPSPSTVVDRIDYSNDTATASAKGPLTAGASYTTGVANLTHGYTLGGRNANHVSTVERIDFANDTANSALRGPLSQTRTRSHAATGNKDFGYIGGGAAGGPAIASSVERVDYSNDSATSVVKGPLTGTRYLLSAAGNSNFGYFGGGAIPAKSFVDRLDYSNDTATLSPKGNLSLARRKLAATGTADFGYFASGTTPSNTVVDRVDYSNDTATASPKGPTAYQTSNPGSASSSTHGYFGGGTPGPLSSVQRIDYANDTATASPRGPMTQARWGLAGMSSRDSGFPKKEIRTVNYAAGTFATSNMGYFVGAYSPTESTVERLDFSNDTANASAKGPLSYDTHESRGAGSPDYGYIGGAASPSRSFVSRIDYTNDTVLPSTKGNLVYGYGWQSAAGNEDYGYWGGHPGLAIARLDYSNDTADALPRGPLSFPASSAAALGNQSYGYWAGGAPNGNYSLVQRLDYSNDTSATSIKGPLASARYKVEGLGNSDFGYVVAGQSVSTVDRIDYSNDTAIAVAKGPLSAEKQRVAGTGTPSFGYIGGGTLGAPSYASISTVDRIDFSNDTSTALSRGSLTTAKYDKAAVNARNFGNPILGPSVVENFATQRFPFTPYSGYYTQGSSGTLIFRIDYLNDTATVLQKGFDADNIYRYATTAIANSNFGYIAGGTPGPKSTVARTTFANDTAAASAKGPLTTAVNYLAAAGNTDFGYIVGGIAPGSNRKSTVQRIDYSNDTANASPKGPLSTTQESLTATGNQNFGYAGGGRLTPSAPYYTSKVDRIDYSNDTATAVAKGPLSAEKKHLAATGNTSFGYFGGGLNSSYDDISTIDRIDYSNDTATASPKGPLAYDADYLAATGYEDFGYFIGGHPSSPSLGGTYIQRVDYSNDTATAAQKGFMFNNSTAVGSAFSAGANGLPQSPV